LEFEVFLVVLKQMVRRGGQTSQKDKVDMNIRYFSLIAAIIIAIVGQVGVTNGTTWDVYNDYPTNVDVDAPNPNGAWSYGYQIGLDYSQGDPFTFFDYPHSSDSGQNQLWQTFNYYLWAGVPAIMMTPNKTPDQYFYFLRGGAVNLNPGLEDQISPESMHGVRSTVRWTAPATGSYSIDALFEGIATMTWHNGYCSCDVNVLKNGVSLFSGDIYGFVGIPGVEAAGGNDRSQTFQQILSLTAGDKLDFSVGDGDRPADFNLDGYTNAADYVAWRAGLGSTYTQADYNTWRSRYNLSNLGSGADSVNLTLTISTVAGAGVSTSSVPEPTTSFLLVVSSLAFAARRVRFR
jgi:hypothetical protein